MHYEYISYFSLQAAVATDNNCLIVYLVIAHSTI